MDIFINFCTGAIIGLVITIACILMIKGLRYNKLQKRASEQIIALKKEIEDYKENNS